MIDSKFRYYYQKFLIDPLLTFPKINQLSPMKVTALAALCGVSVAPFLAFQQSWLAVSALLLSGYLDTLDGSLARRQQKASPIGAVFDITSDRLVEFCVLLGLFLYDPEARAMPTLLMLGSVLLCITSFLVVGIFSENRSEKSFHYSPGLMERSEAFALWSVMILWPASFSFLSYAFCALVGATTAIRLVQFSRQASG